MRLPVRLLESAIDDLTEIVTFIAQDREALEAALGYIDRIEKRCNSIGDAPRGYVLRPDLGDDVRLVAFEKSAVIAYRIHNDTVEITNIFYGGRNYEALIGKE